MEPRPWQSRDVVDHLLDLRNAADEHGQVVCAQCGHAAHFSCFGDTLLRGGTPTAEGGFLCSFGCAEAACA